VGLPPDFGLCSWDHVSSALLQQLNTAILAPHDDQTIARPVPGNERAAMTFIRPVRAKQLRQARGTAMPS